MRAQMRRFTDKRKSNQLEVEKATKRIDWPLERASTTRLLSARRNPEPCIISPSHRARRFCRFTQRVYARLGAHRARSTGGTRPRETRFTYIGTFPIFLSCLTWPVIVPGFQLKLTIISPAGGNLLPSDFGKFMFGSRNPRSRRATTTRTMGSSIVQYDRIRPDSTP